MLLDLGWGNNMNINFESYRIFYYVAKNKNITKAATELHISQPGVSKSLKILEEQLGCKLCLRSKKGIFLTAEGKAFYEELKRGIDSFNNAEYRLKEMLSLETGLIRIGISNTLTQNYLLDYIKIFNDRYPKIKIQIYTNPTCELLINARNHALDFIILNLPYDIPEDFTKKILMETHDTLVSASSRTIPEKITLDNINDYPLIIMARNSNTRYFLDNYFLSYKMVLSPEMELASYQLVTKFIEKDLGIGFLTKEFITKQLEDGTLKELNTNITLPSRAIGLVWLKDKTLSVAATKFVEILGSNNAKA